MPAMAVARTMPCPCQKCWRYIICHRCSIRVGSSPTTSCGDVLDRPDDGPRVPFERGLAPAEQPVLIGDDLHEHPVPHPGVADVRLDASDLHGGPLWPRKLRDCQRRDQTRLGMLWHARGYARCACSTPGYTRSPLRGYIG